MAKQKGEDVSNPNTVMGSWDERTKKFQNHNPMLQTDFERNLCYKEKMERHLAKVKYTLGIQGVDGGKFPRGQS